VELRGQRTWRCRLARQGERERGRVASSRRLRGWRESDSDPPTPGDELDGVTAGDAVGQVEFHMARSPRGCRPPLRRSASLTAAMSVPVPGSMRPLQPRIINEAVDAEGGERRRRFDLRTSDAVVALDRYAVGVGDVDDRRAGRARAVQFDPRHVSPPCRRCRHRGRTSC